MMIARGVWLIPKCCMTPAETRYIPEWKTALVTSKYSTIENARATHKPAQDNETNAQTAHEKIRCA